MIRWIAALLGFIFFRFPGAIIGFLIGSFFYNFNSSGANPINRTSRVTPADFEVNLLSLASIVIKADGSVSEKEMQFVQNYFVQAYGK